MHAASRRLAAAAVVVLVVSVAPAFADFATGGTLTEFLPGDFTDGVAPDTAAARLPDGNLVFDKTAILGGSFVDFDAAFVPGQSRLQLVLHSGAVTGAYLTSVTFTNTGDGTSAFVAGLTAAEGALTGGGASRFSFTTTGTGPYVLTTLGAFSTYDRIAATFAFDAAGDRLALDAVENPEPGTLALFSIGAAGLAIVVRRRRRAAVPAR